LPPRAGKGGDRASPVSDKGGRVEGERAGSGGVARRGVMVLEVRREMIRRNRLIERCSVVRKAAGDPEMKRLLDRIEALLTRLDMLDPGDGAAMRAFSSALRGSDVRERIEEALAGRSGDPALRAWLFEALLILRGAEVVG